MKGKQYLERTRERYWHTEQHRLRGVLLVAIGAEETQIEASFCEAITIAKKQKSVSLEKRIEATFAEYRHKKAPGARGRGFRLPLCCDAAGVKLWSSHIELVSHPQG
jgi:hypothetical protein